MERTCEGYPCKIGTIPMVVHSLDKRTPLEVGRICRIKRVDTLESEIVELWHQSETAMKPLHEYLHMTKEQYQAWAINGTPVCAALRAGETK